MKIDRTALVSGLLAFAERGNGIIVGKPGVGKSYALAEMRDLLKRRNIPHLILPVERLGDGSDEDLRSLLRREGNLVDLLRAIPIQTQSQRPVLIFDGFDASRGERQREGILKLIKRAVEELSETWSVIVSVRVFDARKSARLLSLFPHLEGEMTPTGDIQCRHIFVPPLTQPELEQAFEQNPLLKEIYDRGSTELRSLLTIPFHLSLVEKTLAAGAEVSVLSSVISEVQLLDQYWKRRVTGLPDADNRRFLLAKAAKKMVRTHTLTVRRESVYEPTAASAWEGLLSDEIIAEQLETDSLSFSHNILFDFAVSALLLESDPATFSRFIAEEPARPLFLRPSLVYHFTRLWHIDRDGFWRNFWHAISQDEIHLRQIIRIVLPAVVIAEARSVSDLSPLQLRVAQGDPVAIDAVAFTIQALRVLGHPRPDLWSQFINALSPHLDRRFAGDAGVVVLGWLQGGAAITPQTREACGQFGRDLLRWSWASRKESMRSWFERIAGSLGIPIVAKTFASEPAESRELLQNVLSVVNEPGFPIDCVWRLTDEVGTLISQAPDFVAEIYRSVFGHEETSEERTNMGTPILGLFSNRRQDYDGCEYNLIQAFPGFIASAPLIAIAAGINAVEAHVRRDHIERYLKRGASFADLQKRFEFRGRDATYTSDGSAIWDETKYPDTQLQLADAIFRWLQNLITNKDEDRVSEFLDAFARTASYAFLWKRLLDCGTEAPDSFGLAIWELAIAQPFLHGTDVRHALGEFLRQVATHLPRSRREQIETAILAIPQTAEKKHDPEVLERWRNRLLGCIPAEALVSDAAIRLRQKLEAEATVPSNEPPFQMTSWTREYSEEQFLREQGAEPDKPENKTLRELYLPLQNWSEKGRTADQIDSLLDTARRLRAALQSTNSAEDPVKLAGWTQLAEFATNAILESDAANPRFTELREIVLLAAIHEEPVPEENEDSKWTSAVWSPAPRNSAAQALPWIAAFQVDSAVLAAIEKLAADPVPSVRFLLSNELWRLGKHAPETLWPLLENFVANEKNKVVLGAVARSLSYAWRFDKRRTLPLILELYGKPHTEDENEFEFWHDVVRIITDYAVWENEPAANELLRKWLAEPLRHKSELATSGRRLIGYIRPQQKRSSFEKARSLLIEHLDSVARGLTELQQAAVKEQTPPPAKAWRQLYGVINEAVMRIYFAADVSANLRQRSEFPLDDISRPKFFRDALPILEKILTFGKTPEAGVLLAPTAHYFMELLNGVVKYDPQLVLRVAADVIESSRKYDYNLDSMAMKEVVTLVEALLTDYSEYIQDEASVRRLLNVLDAFVDAGWPDALNLVWRLDEVYR